MKRIKPVYIEARDIPDAWFQCVSEIQDKGFRYEIEQGSFVGQTRLEFDHVTIKINHPYSEPYDTMLPDIPSHLGIPNPVANGYIEQYLPYLMTNSRLPDEDYTYGSRIAGGTWYSNLFQSYVTGINQIEYMINLLRTTPHTNQAILQVAQPEDCLLNDPPCMRHLDLRIRDYLDIKEMKVKKYLIVYPYFRSWDLWSGMAANLAAIAVLQKYMADEIGVESGCIIASSKGLHLYGYEEFLAKLRVGK